MAPDKDLAAAIWIAQLHAAALALPRLEPAHSAAEPSIPATTLERAQQNLACFNGCFYRDFLDPDPTLDEESVLGDIGDDLLDIYLDIKAGCLLFERGDTPDAAWQWRFSHRSHWGRHAVGALFALHAATA